MQWEHGYPKILKSSKEIDWDNMHVQLNFVNFLQM